MLINAQMRYQRLKNLTKGKFVSRFEFEKTKGQLCFCVLFASAECFFYLIIIGLLSRAIGPVHLVTTEFIPLKNPVKSLG